MALSTDVRLRLPSALQDDKLQTIHMGENNQYRNEDGTAYVDEKVKEQILD